MPSPRDGQFGVALDVTLDLPLASLGSRALAQVLDVCLLQVVQIAVVLTGLALMAAAGITFGESATTWVVVVFLVVLFSIQWGWFAAWELAWEGQTPGKRALGLRVVADDGGAAGTVAILVRNLLRTVDFLPGGYCLGVLVMFFHPQSKRVGDLAGGTVVVVEGRPTREVRRVWPSGLGAADVRLVERFFAEAWSLAPERRAELGRLLLARLAERHPGLVRDVPEDPVAALLALFPEAP